MAFECFHFAVLPFTVDPGKSKRNSTNGLVAVQCPNSASSLERLIRSQMFVKAQRMARYLIFKYLCQWSKNMTLHYRIQRLGGISFRQCSVSRVPLDQFSCVETYKTFFKNLLELEAVGEKLGNLLIF